MNGMQNLSIGKTVNEKENWDVMEKNAEISEKTRNIGNKLLGKKSHDKNLHRAVLSTYSKSIAYAPENSEKLAAAYSNRSVLLMHLGRNKESLVDIDRALQITKSEALLQKLVARKAKLVNSNKSLIKALDVNGSQCQSPCKQNNSEGLNITRASAIVPSASDSVLLKYNETFGRHYIAARDIEPGEVVIVEESYVCIPKNNLRYLLCSHCLLFAWNGIPCCSCPFAIYCSEECKKEAWEDYHELECQISPYLAYLQSDANGCVLADLTIALRIFLKAVKREGLDTVLNEAENIDNEKANGMTGLLTKGVLQSDKFRSCYNLSSNVQYKGLQQEVLVHTTPKLIDILLTRTTLLDEKKMSGDKISNSLFSQLNKILNKIRYIADVNALSYQGSICECPDLDEPQCSCGSNRGMIIAPSSSLVNHSCCANLSRIFLPKKRVVYFTVTPVKKGEQLCDSYGPSIRMERGIRQRQLQQNFHFTCKCKACTENWPCITKMQLLLNTKTITNAIYQVIYAFKKVYPKENESFINKLPEDTWGINKEGLEKAKLASKLIFKYINDYKYAFCICNRYRYYIDKCIFNLHGEKCTVPSVCL